MSHPGSTIRLEDEPEGWRKLTEKARRQKDPKKLDAIIKQVNQLLTEHEKRCAATTEKSPHS